MMNRLRKKLPVGIQSFETMRTEHYLHVDKTEGIYRMVTEDKFYVLSRPRRFGKSLLVSTLAYPNQEVKHAFFEALLFGPEARNLEEGKMQRY